MTTKNVAEAPVSGVNAKMVYTYDGFASMCAKLKSVHSIKLVYRMAFMTHADSNHVSIDKESLVGVKDSLGVSDSTISRCLSDLHDNGIIYKDSNHVWLNPRLIWNGNLYKRKRFIREMNDKFQR